MTPDSQANDEQGTTLVLPTIAPVDILDRIEALAQSQQTLITEAQDIWTDHPFGIVTGRGYFSDELWECVRTMQQSFEELLLMGQQIDLHRRREQLRRGRTTTPDRRSVSHASAAFMLDQPTAMPDPHQTMPIAVPADTSQSGAA